ncbi:uncharacterized protein LOC110729254 [Chenopodium quinoa]|uniref:uncharacterized protein LOC110729254 n=1 Tax=Chenopodium quinoa TaxID=63459 RepID=UPI000B7968CB|nr:uncharacterized protein LOC110729254 [Chenopodium quinoa]XP_021764674.1 uncharacterized protein LOC110729254 [Chenopodium quinoa]XP_021764675.1 uncharacterized protein LOC110729254 [Chenopodium quinoa]XP_021764676.1 uncharacterized protein LOC110729254 [Chenopodium quinoa]
MESAFDLRIDDPPAPTNGQTGGSRSPMVSGASPMASGDQREESAGVRKSTLDLTLTIGRGEKGPEKEVAESGEKGKAKEVPFEMAELDAPGESSHMPFEDMFDDATDFANIFETNDATLDDILTNSLSKDFQYQGSKEEAGKEREVSEKSKGPKTKQVVDANKRPRREVTKLPACLKSSFMIKYVDLFKNVSAMQATLSDYAFSEGPNNEVLYHDGENSVNREEMRTLGTDEEVDNAVIDAWAHILNTKGKKT